jgi:peptidoglycan hydrolase-like protein with peptidoglycan-binding domain
MNPKLCLTALCFLMVLSSRAGADQAVESAQQKLKEDGFYYGDIHGTKDADTTAAIRRYQIRNGLQVTGELDAETRRSLGLAADPSPTPPSRPVNTPAPSRSNAPEEPRAPATTKIPPRPPTPSDRTEQDRDYVPGPYGLRPETSGIFDGTPFEVAPPEVQRRVLIGAQTLLARRGFYRGSLDGAYGPEMNFAVRAFQARLGLPATGRLDLETLASLGLLPGQRRPGFGPPRRRTFPPRSRIGPGGERVYIPD